MDQFAEKVTELVVKKMDEIRGQEPQRNIFPTSPVTPVHNASMPQIMSPLGYGAPEPHGHPTNLIETARPESTAMNPNIVCYNCENPGHYESRCPMPRVAPDIRAEHVQRINANSGRRKSYPPRSGQSGKDKVQQEVEFLRRQNLELQRASQGHGQFAAGYGPIAAGPGQYAAGQGHITAGPGQIAAGPGQFAAGQGQFTAGQGLIKAGPGQSGSGQGQLTNGHGPMASGQGQGQGQGQGEGPNAVNLIETENVGMVASALEDLTY